jgi:hypothetical protein
MRALLSQAVGLARQFHEARLTALQFEEGLLALGFYNVEFSPPAAAFDGVRYDLQPLPSRKAKTNA